MVTAHTLANLLTPVLEGLHLKITRLKARNAHTHTQILELGLMPHSIQDAEAGRGQPDL